MKTRNLKEARRLAHILEAASLRFGELKWLSWEDIDWNQNKLHVRPKPGWKPKSGDARVIPLSPSARAVLQRQAQRHRWVFTMPPSRAYPHGGNQLSEQRLLVHLKRRLKRLSLPGKLHTFRHHFISHALIHGTPEAVVRGWVGHVDPEIIRMYTHIADQASQAAMDRLAKQTQAAAHQPPARGCEREVKPKERFQHIFISANRNMSMRDSQVQLGIGFTAIPLTQSAEERTRTSTGLTPTRPSM